MASLSHDKASGVAQATSRSLEPSEAWIGADAKPRSKARASTARAPGVAVRRPKRSVLKYVTLALLVGAAGAYAAGGGLDLSGQNAERAAQSEAAAPAATSPTQQKTAGLDQVEIKRKALLDEIKKLETQRSEQQGEITELSDRRTNLSQELSELERQRQEQASKLAGADEGTMSAKAPAAEGDEVPLDGDEAAASVPAKPAADLEAVAKLEQERKGKIDALAAVQRKEEEAQKRIREVKEKKAAAEREFAANKRREREAAARVQQEAASRLALGGVPEPQVRRVAPQPPAPAAEEEPSSGLMAGLFGGPVAGYAREQRSPYVPMPVATRFPTSAAAPKRVFVHFSAYDPNGRAKAYATARRLQSEGFAVAELRPVRTRVRGNSVRFFHEGDRGSMPSLRGAVSRSVADSGTSVHDFRHFDRPPSEGTLEVWLAE